LSDSNLVARYNYNKFIPANFEQWMNFDSSPVLGQPAPDFSLWDLEEKETTLYHILSQNLYTIVEFGSFT